MSTQLSENTVKFKLSDLREHCRDLLREPEPATPAPPPPPHGAREHAAPRERRA